MRRARVVAWVLLWIGGFSQETRASSETGQTADEGTGRRMVVLAPVPEVQIEMPDLSTHDFGQDFQAQLITQLTQSGRYEVFDPHSLSDQGSPEGGAQILVRALSQSGLPVGYEWNGSATPVATIRVGVDALSFTTGSRGDRMFYGFDERFRTPFNDGSGRFANEFPLRLLIPNEAGWFGHAFDQKGAVPFDSRSGLDLGDGFELDAVMAWLNVKYASYHAELRLDIRLESPIGNPSVEKKIQVSGDGFFFDVSGAYQQYSMGIAVARRDAMNQAFQKAIRGSFSAIDRALSGLPRLASVDAVMPDQTILMGTGLDAGVSVGMVYQLVSNPGVWVEVIASVPSGSMGRVVAGDVSQVKPQQILQQKEIKTGFFSNSFVSGPTREVLQLPSANLPQSNLTGLVPLVTRAEAFAKSLVEGIFLPYRIWRYFKYDEAYHRKADSITAFQNGSKLRHLEWDLGHESWSKAIGLANVPAMKGGAMGGEDPVVAVIDSGIDYNHPALHDSIWNNSKPLQDAQGRTDHYGWDFISNDARPYDDGYHGTQVASVVLGVAPRARLMALKIFNPWGITSSAAFAGAMVYAVDHGAQVVVCGWAAVRRSQSLIQGIAYAQAHGVAVVTAAGDDGVDLAQEPDYFPAVLSKDFDNLVTVTGVDGKDHLWNGGARSSNFDPKVVQLAAPSSHILVAEPRIRTSFESSTGLAAAMVAGALARYANSSESAQQWIQALMRDADSVAGLKSAVHDGLRLHIRR